MSDVKRCTIYEAYALLPYGAKVIAEVDYDALLAERDQLRAELAEYQEDPSYVTACETIRKLRAELEAIMGQQAVAWASPDVAGGVRWSPGALQQLSDGSPLYALPPQQPDAVSVPRELLDKLLHAEAECLHGQFEEALESLRALSTKNAE